MKNTAQLLFIGLFQSQKSLYILGFLFFSLSMPTRAGEAIYKQVLPNGEVTYSNQNAPDSKQIILPAYKNPLDSNPPPLGPVSDSSPSQATDPITATQTNPAHYQIQFIQPENGQVYPMGLPQVHITLNISPALDPTDKLQLFIDDKPYGRLQSESTYTLSHLNRGEHTVQVKIYSLTEPQKVKGETGVVVVHIQRAHVS